MLGNCFKVKEEKMDVLGAIYEYCSEEKYNGEEIVENIVQDLNEVMSTNLRILLFLQWAMHQSLLNLLG